MSCNQQSQNYFAIKMRESRERRKNADKTFYKKFLYTVDINGKKYVYRNKSDIKIHKISKEEIQPEYIKLY